MVYDALSRKSASFFDWYVYMIELAAEMRLLLYTHTAFPFVLPPNPLYTNYLDRVHVFYFTNQKLRWRIKRLVNWFLRKRCAKRIIGADLDILTLEHIPIEKQIRMYCFPTRSMYIFSESALLSAICSNLGSQLYSIPNMKRPVNPFTNLPFGYGQMVEMYYECVRVCVNTRRKIPILLQVYRECNFQSNLALKMYYSSLQLHATQTYLSHDDPDTTLLYENMDALFKAYLYTHRFTFRNHLSLDTFKLWRRMDPSNALHKQWRSLVADYWFYEQTHVLCRGYWHTEEGIFQDVETLLEASHVYIVHAVKESRRQKAT